MTVIEQPKPFAHGPQIWPLSVPAYHALGELDLVPERAELLYGEVYFKKPKPPQHSYLAGRLYDLLHAAVTADCYVSPGQPITGPDSEPEPDLAVIRGSFEDYAHAHPTTAELVIEICVTTHDYDRSKLRAYATAGVKECWLVLGPEKQIEVHRQPQGGHFEGHSVHGPGGSLTSAVLPGFTVTLDSFFAA